MIAVHSYSSKRYDWHSLGVRKQLLYWGKIIGTVAGLATRQWPFVLLGFVLGHQFDRGFAARFESFRAEGEAVGRFNDGWVRALFRTMGHVAKIDGRVSEDEIRAARSVMYRLGLSPAQVRLAISWFNDGKEPGFALAATLRELRRDNARTVDARAVFVRLVLEVSLTKSSIGKPERAAIWTICNELGMGRVELAQLEAMIRAQKGFRRSPEGDADAAKVRKAYATLGVSQDSTNAEIKKAYRRLMNKNHPDKIASSDPDAKVVAEAERRTREIRAAFDLIKVRRSIR